jgi:hypothetical protein
MFKITVIIIIMINVTHRRHFDGDNMFQVNLVLSRNITSIILYIS